MPLLTMLLTTLLLTTWLETTLLLTMLLLTMLTHPLWHLKAQPISFQVWSAIAFRTTTSPKSTTCSNFHSTTDVVDALLMTMASPPLTATWTRTISAGHHGATLTNLALLLQTSLLPKFSQEPSTPMPTAEASTPSLMMLPICLVTLL